MRFRALALCGLCFACSPDPHALSWELSFASAVLQARATVMEATIRRGDCASADVVYSEVFGVGATGSRPPPLGPGTYGFDVWARDRSCAWIAHGCVERQLPATGSLAVSLGPPGMRAAACAAGCSAGWCPDEPGHVAADGGADTGVDAGVGGIGNILVFQSGAAGMATSQHGAAAQFVAPGTAPACVRTPGMNPSCLLQECPAPSPTQPDAGRVTIIAGAMGASSLTLDPDPGTGLYIGAGGPGQLWGDSPSELLVAAMGATVPAFVAMTTTPPIAVLTTPVIDVPILDIDRMVPLVVRWAPLASHLVFVVINGSTAAGASASLTCSFDGVLGTGTVDAGLLAQLAPGNASFTIATRGVAMASAGSWSITVVVLEAARSTAGSGAMGAATLL